MTISVRQPWATLLAHSLKHYETRSWRTRYEGPLAIHASARFAPEDYAWTIQTPAVCKLLAKCGYTDASQLPLGCLLAAGQLVGCWPTRTFPVAGLSRVERTLGDFSPGRWAWRLSNVKLLSQPIPYKGALGLWQCTIPDNAFEVQP